MTAPTKFYSFRQNNSGGSYVRDDDLDASVYIEAVDADHANARAANIGIYFDGCSTGQDCSCCGDRWYPAGAYGDDSGIADEDSITVYRSAYTEKPYETGDVPLKIAATDGGPLGTFTDCGVIVHRLDGTKSVYRGPSYGTKDRRVS
jgi:hypothetical protein